MIGLVGPRPDDCRLDRIVDELARVLHDPDEAQELVLRAGFPRSALPVFGTPQVFWSRVVRSAEDGRMPGGVEALVEHAAKGFPGNQFFTALVSSTSVTVAGGSDTAVDEEKPPGEAAPSLRAVPGPRWRAWALSGAAMLAAGLSVYSGSFDDTPQPERTPAESQPSENANGGDGAAYRDIPSSTLHELEQDPPLGMRWVPGGTFLRGSSESEWRAAYEACRNTSAEAWDPENCSMNTWKREQRVHRETHVESFFLDINEVTVREVAGWLDEQVADHAAFIEDDLILDAERRVWGKLREKAEPGRPDIRQLRVTRQGVVDAEPDRGEHPMGLVTWSLARAYCESRGARLPSEAEWEWAARGTRRVTYPWGEEPPACTDVVLDRVKGGRCAHLGVGPAPTGAGSEDVTWAGIRDLGGGVAEWVANAYVDDTTVHEGVARCVRADLSGGDGEPRQCHVFKGGSWAWPTLFARAAARSVAETTPTDVDVLRRNPDRWVMVWDVGFRCARDVENDTVKTKSAR